MWFRTQPAFVYKAGAGGPHESFEGSLITHAIIMYSRLSQVTASNLLPVPSYRCGDESAEWMRELSMCGTLHPQQRQMEADRAPDFRQPFVASGELGRATREQKKKVKVGACARVSRCIQICTAHSYILLCGDALWFFCGEAQAAAERRLACPVHTTLFMAPEQPVSHNNTFWFGHRAVSILNFILLSPPSPVTTASATATISAGTQEELEYG